MHGDESLICRDRGVYSAVCRVILPNVIVHTKDLQQKPEVVVPELNELYCFIDVGNCAPFTYLVVTIKDAPLV